MVRSAAMSSVYELSSLPFVRFLAALAAHLVYIEWFWYRPHPDRFKA
jgi:hypothetical protein